MYHYKISTTIFLEDGFSVSDFFTFMAGAMKMFFACLWRNWDLTLGEAFIELNKNWYGTNMANALWRFEQITPPIYKLRALPCSLWTFYLVLVFITYQLLWGLSVLPFSSHSSTISLSNFPTEKNCLLFVFTEVKWHPLKAHLHKKKKDCLTWCKWLSNLVVFEPFCYQQNQKLFFIF